MDASSDHPVWTERFDRDLEDIFELQDEITQRVAATVAPELENMEATKLGSRQPVNFDAWDYYQRGNAALFDFTEAGNELARRMFRRAIKLEPTYSRAFTGLAYSYHRDIFWDYAKSRDEWIKEFIKVARRAVELDDTNSSSHLVLGYAYIWAGQHDLAVAAERQALELHPGNAFAT